MHCDYVRGQYTMSLPRTTLQLLFLLYQVLQSIFHYWQTCTPEAGKTDTYWLTWGQIIHQLATWCHSYTLFLPSLSLFEVRLQRHTTVLRTQLPAKINLTIASRRDFLADTNCLYILHVRILALPSSIYLLPVSKVLICLGDTMIGE